MGEFSKIAWTDNTFNVWIGCTKVSAGCANCYAEAWDKRMFAGENWGPDAPRKAMSEGYWSKPINWDKKAEAAGIRTRVFCSSLADVFDKEGLADARARMWRLMKRTPNLDWLLLTKRPENILGMLPGDWGNGYANAWIGVTAEDNASAKKRIDAIRNVPAAVKFLSVEPQLEEIDFSGWLAEDEVPFDWMIFGGESGSNARRFDPEWIKKPMAEAGKAGVARFVKQMGAVWAKENDSSDSKGGNDAEWPDWLKVREFPVPRNVA